MAEDRKKRKCATCERQIPMKEEQAVALEGGWYCMPCGVKQFKDERAALEEAIASRSGAQGGEA